MVSLLVANGSQLYEDEPRRHTDLCQVGKQNGFLQANKSNQGLRQTLHFTDQNICCLRTWWDLL